MATPRKQFAQKLQYRRGRDRLNSEKRRAIIQDLLNHVPINILAQRYSCHRNTIRNTWKRWKERDNFNDRPHLGPKPRLTPRERRILFRYIRNDPTRRWIDLLQFCENIIGKKVSKNTIRRAFRALKLNHWRSLKRIFLSKKAIFERNRFWRFWYRNELALLDVCLLSYTFTLPR
jgi:transposase-like protein